jgi:hypothetical protein
MQTQSKPDPNPIQTQFQHSNSDGFSIPFFVHFYPPAQAIFSALKWAENTHDLLLKMASEIEPILADIATSNSAKVRRTFFSSLGVSRKN